MTFSDWMKKRRRELRMTQQHLAERAGFSRSYIVTLESGAITLPQMRTRSRLHAVLNTDDQELEDLGILAVDEYGGEYSPNAERLKTTKVVEPVTTVTIDQSMFHVLTASVEIIDADEKRKNLKAALDRILLTSDRYHVLDTLLTDWAILDMLEPDSD